MISIITPVFNAGKYIEACIENVASQWTEGIEHLILDGGSTDETIKIVEEKARQYPYIRWWSEKDKGQSDAMNKGINRASNPIVSFLNADDHYEAGCLKRVMEEFQTLQNPAFLVGNCRVLKEDGSVYMINKPWPFDRVLFMMDYNFPFNPSAYFYHKSIHTLVGFYDENDHLTMDIDFLFRLPPTVQIKYIDEVLGNYVMVSNSKTMQEISAGRNVENLRTVFARYIPQLRFSEKIRLAFHRSLGKNRGWVLYYLENPGAAIQRLIQRGREKVG
jgi:glycosyltransferase involved in cell wall biosynthesis